MRFARVVFKIVSCTGRSVAPIVLDIPIVTACRAVDGKDNLAGYSDRAVRTAGYACYNCYVCGERALRGECIGFEGKVQA